jgi:hypothetical protein
MTATYDKDAVTITYNDHVVLQGIRNHQTRLWEIPLPMPDTIPESANNVIRNDTDHKLMAFYQEMLFSPVMSTMTAAAKAGLLDFLPGFTADKLIKNQVHTMATAKGHLNRTRQGRNSTHRTETVQQRAKREQREEAIAHAESFPSRLESRTERVIVHMVPLHTFTEHMDATGKFMLQSRASNWYVLVMFNEDANYIHFEMLKSRHADSYREAVTKGHEFFAARGFTPAYSNTISMNGKSR